MQPERWLEIQALNAPDRIAVVSGGSSRSFSELLDLARGIARGLQEMGVEEGSRVAVSLPAGHEFALLAHALLMTGATMCPLDPRDPAPALDHDFVFDHESGIPTSPDGVFEAPCGGPDSVVCEITTSGTTGTRKRIRLTASNVLWSALGSAHALGVAREDRWLVCLPVFHVSGLMPLYRALIYGTAVSIHPGFSPESVVAELDSGEITGISLVPTALEDLLDLSVTSLRRVSVVLVGGAASPPSLIRRAVEASVPVAMTYGMTEAASQVTILPPDQVPSAPGSVGRPLDTVRLKVESGEVLVSGPVVARDCVGEDGWYRTGDRGTIDGDGRLWIEGRADEMIISGGENVSPSEVEAVLIEHPAVVRAAVFSSPDPRWQEQVRAAVVLDPKASVEPDDLRIWCEESLPPYKVPKRVDSVEEIPLGSSGKPDRRELAKRLSDDPR